MFFSLFFWYFICLNNRVLIRSKIAIDVRDERKMCTYIFYSELISNTSTSSRITQYLNEKQANTIFTSQGYMIDFFLCAPSWEDAVFPLHSNVVQVIYVRHNRCCCIKRTKLGTFIHIQCTLAKRCERAAA